MSVFMSTFDIPSHQLCTSVLLHHTFTEARMRAQRWLCPWRCTATSRTRTLRTPSSCRTTQVPYYCFGALCSGVYVLCFVDVPDHKIICNLCNFCCWWVCLRSFMIVHTRFIHPLTIFLSQYHSIQVRTASRMVPARRLTTFPRYVLVLVFCYVLVICYVLAAV